MDLRTEGDRLCAALRNSDAEEAERVILRILAADPAAAEKITRAVIAAGLRNMAAKKCGGQVKDSTGRIYTCQKDAHLSPVHRDGDVLMIGLPWLPVLVTGPQE